jgi:PAS domain S-box-containing protein
LARLLESGVAGVFRTAEVALDLVVIDERFRNDLGQSGLVNAANTLAGHDSSWRAIQAIGSIDADGAVAQAVARDADGAFSPVSNLDLSASESFLVHRAMTAATDRIFLSKVMTGLSSGEEVIVLSRGLWGPDGAFRGMGTVSVRRDEISWLFDGLLSEVAGTIALYRRDGSLLAAAPSSARDVPAMNRPPYLLPLASAGAPSCVLSTAAAEDGVGRRLAYRAAERYPVVVAVGLSFWIRRQNELRDETQRREHRLAESQRLGAMGHFERDLTGSVYRWSPNMYPMHGVSPSSFVPDLASMALLLVPEDRAGFIDAVVKWPTPSGVGQFEGRIRAPDGGLRYLRYEWRLFDDGGPEPRIFGVAKDITALRNAEAARKDNEARLTDILECSSDFICETDSDGVFTVFSGAGVDLFHSPLGLDGTTFYLLSDDAGDLLELEQTMSVRRQFGNRIVAARSATGGQRWIRISGNARFDDQGRFQGYRGAGTDVTEQRRQIELLEAQRKGEALGRLAGGLAHEINNLLQPIMIYSSAGSAAPGLGAELRSYFSRILRSAEQASGIVRNVLGFARRSPPRKEDVELSGAIRDIIDIAAPIIGPDVKIEFGGLPAGLIARVDRTGFAQTMINLLTNAVEAMARTGTIAISADEVTGPRAFPS